MAPGLSPDQIRSLVGCSFNLLTKDAIPITNEVLRRRVVRKCVNKLLANPFGIRMLGHIEVKHFSPIVGKNHKDVKNAEGNCRPSKEIDRDELLAMIF